MVQIERQSLPGLPAFAAVTAAVLIGLSSPEANAQDADSACPCFSYQEVESIILRSEQLTAEQGTSECKAEDYKVECMAEVSVWDQDYNVIAQARVNWYDFDPSRCNYIDTIGNPGVERNVRWPHPAPEDTARACFDIISSVISKSATSGRCDTYP